MGTFERIRKMSPYALGLFAVLFILFMVLADMDPTALMQQRAESVAVINGKDIKYAEFESMNRRLLENQRYQIQQQGGDPENIKDASIRNDTWNSFLDQATFEKISDDAGMVLNDDVVSDELIYNPPQNIRQSFTDSTGAFQRNQYQQFVTNPEAVIASSDPNGQLSQDRRRKLVADIRQQLINAADQIRGNMIERGVRNIIQTSGSYVSPNYARLKYINENSNVDFEYVKFDITSIKDDQVEISDEELKSYYNEINPYLNEKAKRQIKYVAFPLVPSANDTAKAKEKISKISTALRAGLANGDQTKAFQTMAAEYGGTTSKFMKAHEIDPSISRYISTLPKDALFGPVTIAGATHFFRVDDKREADEFTVNASHILIRMNDNKDSALKVAKDLVKRARAGEDFSMLASEFSEDRGSAQKGGELGWFGKGSMVEEFENAAFAADVDEITEPVESQFGYHIIKVNNKTKDEIRYSQITVEPRMSGVTRNLVYNKAKSFYDILTEDNMNFDTLASQNNVNAIETAEFERSQAILGNNFITNFAFNNNVGSVSEPIEVPSLGVVVFKVSDASNDGAPSLEQMKPQVLAYAKKQKKLDMLKEKATNAAGASSLSSLGMDVKTASNVKNNGSVPGAPGKEYALTEAAYNAPLNQVYGPIRGESGYYLINVKSRNLVADDVANQQIDSYRNQLMGNLERQVYYPWFRTIKSSLEIEDNRSMFYNNY